MPQRSKTKTTRPNNEIGDAQLHSSTGPGPVLALQVVLDLQLQALKTGDPLALKGFSSPTLTAHCVVFHRSVFRSRKQGMLRNPTFLLEERAGN